MDAHDLFLWNGCKAERICAAQVFLRAERKLLEILLRLYGIDVDAFELLCIEPAGDLHDPLELGFYLFKLFFCHLHIVPSPFYFPAASAPSASAFLLRSM